MGSRAITPRHGVHPDRGTPAREAGVQSSSLNVSRAITSRCTSLVPS